MKLKRYHILFYYLVFTFFTISLSTNLIASGISVFEKMDIFLKKQLSRDGILSVIESDELYILAKSIGEQELFSRRYDLAVFGDVNYISGLGIPIHARFSNFITTRISLAELHTILHNEKIERVEKGGTFDILLNESLPEIKADHLHKGLVNDTPFTGKGVVIGIIDTGIDIYHPDFHIPGDVPMTRIVSIWDMTLDPQDDELPPRGFTRGVEYSREQIDNEIRDNTRGFIRSMDTHAHGTHVAGIAGGNGVFSNGLYTGVAPDAEFIIVRVAPRMIDEIWIVDGLYYIFNKAQELGRPAVINLSLGNHRGAHDGTAISEIVIDELTKFEGRIVVVAGGNSGDSFIHTGGTISAGQITEFTINIRPYTPDPIEENRFVSMLWYEGSRRANIRVQSPNGFIFHTTGNDSIQTPDGKIFIYSDGPNLKNARVFLLDLREGDEFRTPRQGDWLVRFQPTDGVGTVRYNHWVVDSNIGIATLSPHSGRAYTVTIPATAENAITVGSYVTKNMWFDANDIRRQQDTIIGSLSDFSSGGPTRDERLKPDITAPGELVTSTLSNFASLPSQVRVSENGYYISRGTSMAAPHVTGVVALMLEANPYLSPDDVRDIFKRTGRTENFAGNIPDNKWGYGKIDAAVAVSMAPQYVSIPSEFTLSQNYPNPFNTGTRFYYRLPEDSDVKIVVYDVLGRRVKILVNEYRPAGTYFGFFIPENISSGVYLLHIRSGTFTDTKKMLYLR